MKHKLIILITLLSVSLYAKAQEYRLTKSTGQLKLNITGVIVEGYQGKEIIFSGEKVANEDPSDERAKGLVPIGSSKHIDNTGLGLSVTENGQDVNVNLATKKPIGILTIKVPNNIKISILSNSFLYSYSTNQNSGFTTISDNSKSGNDIVIKNIKSEIEVSVQNSKIRLENNTGPMNIKTVSGPVEAVFISDIKGPISIISVNNYVDVTLPASTKANIEMGTNYGKLYASKEFKIDLDKVTEVESNRIAARTPVARSIVAGQQVTDVTSAILSTKGANRSAARSTKVRDTATVKEIITTTIVNGKHIIELPKGTVRVQELDKLTGTLATTINGSQINGDKITSNSPKAYTYDYVYDHLFSSGDKIKGKLNGGGIDLIFKSTNKNVYLRQQ